MKLQAKKLTLEGNIFWFAVFFGILNSIEYGLFCGSRGSSSLLRCASSRHACSSASGSELDSVSDNFSSVFLNSPFTIPTPCLETSFHQCTRSFFEILRDKFRLASENNNV